MIKAKEQELYTSPEMKVVGIKVRQILCGSTQSTFGFGSDNSEYSEQDW